MSTVVEVDFSRPKNQVWNIPDLSVSLTEIQKERIWKWIGELRSGKYPQTVETLRNKKGFCCLGVACDLSAKDVGMKWRESSTSLMGTQAFVADGPGHHLPLGSAYNCLPKVVEGYYGLPESLGFEVSVYGREGLVPIAQLNDNGYTFVQMSKIIEAALVGKATLEL